MDKKQYDLMNQEMLNAYLDDNSSSSSDSENEADELPQSSCLHVKGDEDKKDNKSDSKHSNQSSFSGDIKQFYE